MSSTTGAPAFRDWAAPRRQTIRGKVVEAALELRAAVIALE